MGGAPQCLARWQCCNEVTARDARWWQCCCCCCSKPSGAWHRPHTTPSTTQPSATLSAFCRAWERWAESDACPRPPVLNGDSYACLRALPLAPPLLLLVQLRMLECSTHSTLSVQPLLARACIASLAHRPRSHLVLPCSGRDVWSVLLECNHQLVDAVKSCACALPRPCRSCHHASTARLWSCWEARRWPGAAGRQLRLRVRLTRVHGVRCVAQPPVPQPAHRQCSNTLCGSTAPQPPARHAALWDATSGPRGAHTHVARHQHASARSFEAIIAGGTG
jgi:hypothetical protein